MDSESTTELGERPVLQPLFAPFAPEFRARLARTSQNMRLGRHATGGNTTVLLSILPVSLPISEEPSRLLVEDAL